MNEKNEIMVVFYSNETSLLLHLLTFRQTEVYLSETITHLHKNYYSHTI